MSDDFFSNEEIVEMEKRTLDRILEAIENEEPEKAKKLSKKMYNEFLAMHDLYRNWITATLSEVGRKYGDEALEEIMTDGCRAWWAPLRKKMDEGGGPPMHPPNICSPFDHWWLSSKNSRNPRKSQGDRGVGAYGDPPVKFMSTCGFGS